jgi:3-oxoacyl-[acyl-carrier-protein] synthase-3
MPMPRPVHLVAAGHAHPDRVLTSAELERTVPGLASGWSEKYLGMHSRRVLGVEGRVSDLLVGAVDDALAEVGWTGDSLDAIVCGTVFPDQVVPGSASYAARVHNPSAVAFDVSAACASFIYALSTVGGLLQTDGFTRAAVCSAEHPTAYADYTDPRSCVFFGDAAGAVLCTTETPTVPSFEVVDIALNGDHEFPEKVFVPRNGTFRSDGRYSFAEVLRLGSDVIATLLERNDVDPGSIAGSVMHQASERVLEELSRHSGMPLERQWHNFEWAGNQSAAGVVTAFSAGWKQHHPHLVPGDHVVLAAVGGGYTGAAALLRWRA